jgi:hypothetical protein
VLDHNASLTFPPPTVYKCRPRSWTICQLGGMPGQSNTARFSKNNNNQSHCAPLFVVLTTNLFPQQPPYRAFGKRKRDQPRIGPIENLFSWVSANRGTTRSIVTLTFSNQPRDAESEDTRSSRPSLTRLLAHFPSLPTVSSKMPRSDGCTRMSVTPSAWTCAETSRVTRVMSDEDGPVATSKSVTCPSRWPRPR